MCGYEYPILTATEFVNSFTNGIYINVLGDYFEKVTSVQWNTRVIFNVVMASRLTFMVQGTLLIERLSYMIVQFI